jgi:hypothetical protein
LAGFPSRNRRPLSGPYGCCTARRSRPPHRPAYGNNRLLHLSENAGRYLQPPGGTLNSDVTELAREEIRFGLRSAAHRAHFLADKLSGQSGSVRPVERSLSRECTEAISLAARKDV